MSRLAPPPKAPSRPDVFRYHDYRVYLKDWLASLKAGQSRLSLRDVAKKAHLSASYLSMVLTGTRKLTRKALLALAPLLELSRTERNYFELLVRLGDSDSAGERADAYERMCRIAPYSRANAAESSTYRYLAQWYNVAIREMASLPGFKADPEWIQPRLRFPVSLQEIRKTLEFLLSNRFLEALPDGSVRPPLRSLDCQGGVYRLALGQFHQQMFSLAARSVDQTSSEERTILGYTLAVDPERFGRIQQALTDLYKMLQEMSEGSPTGDEVVHVELALFPLSKKKKDEAL